VTWRRDQYGFMMTSQNDFANADSLITIDLDAIAANWRYLDSLSGPGTQTAGVIKANGYGLGAIPVAKRLSEAGCRLFFVMSIEEGIAVRQALAGSPHEPDAICCLSGCHQGQEDAFITHGLTPVINDLTQMARLSMFAKRRNSSVRAALHIDTGMSRLGLNRDETDWLIEHMQDGVNALEAIELTHMMSHLSTAENPSAAANAAQLNDFRALAPFFPGVRRSLANSGGILLGRDWHFDMTRPGIAVYGEHPAGAKPDIEAPSEGGALSSVVRWDARILQLRNAASGDTVGYGGTHVLTRDSRIATVGVGYGDGYPRCLGGIANVQIAGHSAPVIGRVSMDSMAIDVTDIPDALLQPDPAVNLLGPHYTPSMMANDAGTISYEILTGLGSRPARRYVSRIDANWT